jgi:hypothetical protein
MLRRYQGAVLWQVAQQFASSAQIPACGDESRIRR